jgi:hypothetical protein
VTLAQMQANASDFYFVWYPIVKSPPRSSSATVAR